MKTFLIELDGKFSSVPINKILSMVTPHCAANLFDSMATSKTVALQLKEAPFYGILRHNEDLPEPKTIEGDVPNLFCVELRWNIPLEIVIETQAHSAIHAEEEVGRILYNDPSQIFDIDDCLHEVEMAYENFEPVLEDASVTSAITVTRVQYPEIADSIINDEREIYEGFLRRV